MAEINEAEYSKITPSGYHVSDCGYCKDNLGRRSPKTRASYYAVSRYLLPSHYQALMDRGWRRSGNLLYLPDMARSCCPHYTIRLPSNEFHASRDQRQAVNRWNRFVLGEGYMKDLDRKYPLTKAEKKAAASTFDLQASIHKSEEQHLKPDLRPAHRFQVTLEHDSFTEEKYLLYQHYQQEVHHEGLDEISRDGFRRFLCQSPVRRQHSGSTKPLGSFHQCYRIDGRLIAVSFLDLLPHAVSGVYFIYHTDFETYSLGKLSAVREAALALESGYQYYYMGYYIHGCDKMKYKASYQPQYVLDMATHGWDLFDDEMRSLMAQKKVVIMSRERQAPTVIEKDSTTAPGDEDEWKISDPKLATESGRSLLDIGMPGVMSLAATMSTIDLDSIHGKFGPNKLLPLSMFTVWDQESVEDFGSFKSSIAELAACVGPEVFQEIILDLQRSFA